MGLPATKRRYTIAEYLQLEEKAVDRHEFHDGEILAMSGGTYEHSVVSTNLTAMTHAALRGKTYRPLDSNMRVRIPNRLNYLYPDISVVCGKPMFDPADPMRTTIINPRVVIEVLSESTESYDRGAKFTLYQQIPSLSEYVLVSQIHPLIETFRRRPNGTWLFSSYEGLKAIAKLQVLKINLPLSEIYAGIEFKSDGTADKR
jgi:Uma2 family endonuclease